MLIFRDRSEYKILVLKILIINLYTNLKVIYNFLLILKNIYWQFFKCFKLYLI